MGTVLVTPVIVYVSFPQNTRPKKFSIGLHACLTNECILILRDRLNEGELYHLMRMNIVQKNHIFIIVIYCRSLLLTQPKSIAFGKLIPV